jgi:lipopolysaccharide/colanic/teichoic acid biosynthesis glycosyltransferase
MTKRHLDIVLASIAFLFSAPLFIFAALGIRISSPGPIFYKASRVGRDRKIFTMYKFRTMDSARSPLRSSITAHNDPRIFPFGNLLRRSKIDELPQLLNVIKGEMSIVGPRPEDPVIVRENYRTAHFETLTVLPGLMSPGSLFNFTHGEDLIGSDSPEQYYVDQLLSKKLALDIVYIREASLLYDLAIILRTAWVITSMTFGKRRFPDPPEMHKALALMEQANASISEDRALPNSTLNRALRQHVVR